MKMLTKVKEGVHERGTRDGSSLAALCSTRWVELRCWFLGIIPPEIKGLALPSESWASWLTFLVAQPCQVDQRGYRVVLVPTCSERGAMRPGGEQPTTLATPRTIPGVGHERALPHAASIFPTG
jgi:hypothetical protein